jgi:integrase
MNEHIEAYLAKIETERGRTAAVQAKYFLKDLPEDLSARGLDAWRTELKGNSAMAASSINRKLTAVRGFLQWLASTERAELSKSAIRDNLGFFGEQKRKVTLPDQASVHRLVELAIARPGRHGVAYCRFVALGLFAGLRPGEIEALTAADLPAGRDYLHVKRTKTGVERHAYFKHSAVLMNCVPDLRGVGGSIVTSGARDWFTSAAEHAGMGKVSRNVLRKLCASHLACSGQFSEYMLMQTLGHNTATSIAHYRDPEILSTIRQGDTIEQWMGLEDLNEALSQRILES